MTIDTIKEVFPGHFREEHISKAIYFVIKGRHVLAFLDDGTRMILDGPLSALEKRFSNDIIRIHGSYAVCLFHTSGVVKGEPGCWMAVVDGPNFGESLFLPISRRRLKILRNALSMMF